MPGETIAERNARLAREAAEDTEGRTAAEDQQLRDDLRAIGIEMPSTTADIMNTGEALFKLRAQLDALAADMEYAIGSPRYNALAQQYDTLSAYEKIVSSRLVAYAGEKFGESARQSVSYLLRPTAPDVQKLPTPVEFLSEYQTAFASHIETMRSAGQISNEAARFATDQLQSEYLSKYTAKMSELAKSGVSPYTLGEVPREARGVGAGTPAGQALDKAFGAGVQEPTTITGLSEDVSKQASDIGTGVPREFTATPRIMPLNFLQEMLSPGSIELAYAGSQYGAGKPVYGAAPSGFKSNTRRA